MINSFKFPRHWSNRCRVSTVPVATLLFLQWSAYTVLQYIDWLWPLYCCLAPFLFYVEVRSRLPANKESCVRLHIWASPSCLQSLMCLFTDEVWQSSQSVQQSVQLRGLSGVQPLLPHVRVQGLAQLLNYGVFNLCYFTKMNNKTATLIV